MATITYVIDNGLPHTHHAIYFVEGPENFGPWLEQTLIPWQRERGLRAGFMMVIATSEYMSWRVRDRVLSWIQFLNSEGLVDRFDFDSREPRPRYEGE